MQSARANDVLIVSFAGLTYLALWLCAKFAITIPFLNYQPLAQRPSIDDEDTPARSQAAAPPTYLLIFPLIPLGAAIYISSTRYSDFWHHGFDVIAGALLGIACAWLGFRWYHLPIQRGGGWAWAPRSPKRAFGRGIGILTYVDNDFHASKGKDLEGGQVIAGENHPCQPSIGLKSSDSAGDYEMGAMEAGQSRRPTRESDSSRRPLR